MAEAIRYREAWPEAGGEGFNTTSLKARRDALAEAGEVLRRLQARSQEVTERISQEVSTRGYEILREVRGGAESVKLRAAAMHEQQPVRAVGMAAASAFAFGLILGLWRH